ncbi:hypothetical protein AVEN_176602-1 [Araneus ventricosus]|uniref:Tc1-like transposase DDE domain-containing protein n=1 Tax=Araneus ventricosus TaxID=182803 RepID=A0A4Y2EH16_ARAVE|nr:hypothetical protein AVEN_176602-1 [Araneus ventricosus]
MSATKEKQRGVGVCWSYPVPFLCSNRGRPKRSDLLFSGVILLHDNAWPYKATRILKKLTKFEWAVFEHQPYNPDLSHLWSAEKGIERSPFSLGRQRHGHYSKLISISAKKLLRTRYSPLGELVR